MIDKAKMQKLAEVGVRNCTQTVPSQDVLDLLSETSRLSSRVQELENALRVVMVLTNPEADPTSVDADAIAAYNVAERALAGKKEGNNG